MQWCAPGFEEAVSALGARLAETAWPDPPAGFEPITAPRPMRVVLRGSLPGPEGAVAVVLKWSRPDTIADHVSRRVRGGKGAREGRVLRRLMAAGVAVPRPLAYQDESFDFLVTAEEPDLEPAPAADAADGDQVAAVAALIARAHAAGLRHRDLHGGNLAFRGAAPLLLDLGSARIGPPLREDARVRALARLHHGLLGGARRSQRLRALRSYLRASGDERPRQSARALAAGIEERARVVRRRYRRGRDRRATRSGRHFHRFGTPDGGRGIRFRDETDKRWQRLAEAWLAGPPADALALKAGGGVLRIRAPDIDRDTVRKAESVLQQDSVLKYYDGVAKGRLPRPLRAFRRAFALQNRGVSVPQPLLAVAAADGRGVYAARYVHAENLHDFSAGGRGGRYAALPARERARLLAGLGRFLRAMHESEVSHRDLKPPNLLARAGDRGWKFVVVDLEGARIHARPVPWARRARDLARLDAGLAARGTDRLRVLRAYFGVLPRPRVSWKAFARRVARHVRRKRGSSGQPR